MPSEPAARASDRANGGVVGELTEYFYFRAGMDRLLKQS
jgi:hypothetical protein